MHLFLYIFGDCIAVVLLYIIHYFSQSAKDFKQNSSKFAQKNDYWIIVHETATKIHGILVANRFVL